MFTYSKTPLDALLTLLYFTLLYFTLLYFTYLLYLGRGTGGGELGKVGGRGGTGSL